MLEEIQAIGEVLSGLGGDAKTAFIVYIVYKLLVTLITSATVLVIVVTLFRKITRIVEAATLTGKLMQIAGIPKDYDFISGEDYKKIYAIFNKGMTA